MIGPRLLSAWSEKTFKNMKIRQNINRLERQNGKYNIMKKVLKNNFLKYIHIVHQKVRM